jgi:hypothetical protein
MSREQIPGWDPIVHIYKEWIKAPPRLGAVVVEVGVALGRSLTFIADWCLANDRRDIEVWAVDSWAGCEPNGEQQTMSAVAGGHFSLYAKMMLEHDPKAFEFIRPLRATSVQASRVFMPESVDLCVIDGDHRYEGCVLDIRAWLPKVRPGGWIGGDDHHPVHHPGVIKACREMFDHYEVVLEANGWPDGSVWLKRLP